MPLTRFPDHEEKRVFLSSVLTLNLPAPDASHSDRLSVAAFWLDRGTPAASELSLEFAVDLVEHGALAVVLGGSAADEAGNLFEQAIAEGEFARSPGEDIEILVQADATLEEFLFIAAEEAMPPDIYADEPWDLVVWCRSGDPAQPRLRAALARLTDLVDEIYDVGGEEE
jgi:hypothetical protein